jgi:hypothetical protein
MNSDLPLLPSLPLVLKVKFLGCSVICYLNDTKEYTLRGVCRNVDDEEARKLKSKGVQMVAGDMVKNSVDELATIMKGSYGAFLMTNFWDPSTMNKGNTSCPFMNCINFSLIRNMIKFKLHSFF